MALGAFDQANYTVVIITPELPSLKGGQDALRIVHDLMHFPDDRVKLVLNQRQATAVLPRETVNRALGRPPDVVIGYDGSKPDRAALQGSILAGNDAKSEIAKGALRLAELIGATAPSGGGR
jgi:Flp pilus assembly CpaE family ATPase